MLTKIKVQAIWNGHFGWYFNSQSEAEEFLAFWNIDKKEVNFGYHTFFVLG